jgi:hypothetical protein
LFITVLNATKIVKALFPIITFEAA